jgi:outer membrane protein assembly factor BamB
MALPKPITVYKDFAETRDFTLSFAADLKAAGDTISSFTVEHDVGIEVVSSALNTAPTGVKVFVRAGAGGSSYRLSAFGATTGGRIWRSDAIVMVSGSDFVWPAVRGGGGAQEDYINSEIVFGGGGAIV